MSLVDKMVKDSQPDIKSEDLGNISDLGRQLSELEDKIRLEEEHLKALN
jgi:hypothetical protein